MEDKLVRQPNVKLARVLLQAERREGMRLGFPVTGLRAKRAQSLLAMRLELLIDLVVFVVVAVAT